MKLRKWQKEFRDWYLRRGDGKPVSAYLHGDLGVGKTIGALAVLKALNLPKDEYFVLAPKSAHPSWIEDGAKMGLAFKTNENLFTYEKFTRLKLLPKVEFFICDEAHRLKNPAAEITKRIWKYYKHTPKLLMSGTPADREYELFSQYRLIDPKMWDGESWTKWKSRYFFVNEYGQPVALLRSEYRHEIARQIDPYTYRVNLDAVEMPPLQPIYHNLPKSPKLAKLWREHQAQLESTVTQFMMAYAIAQGIHPETHEIVDTAKIDYAIDFVKDNPHTIVFSYFQAPVKYVAEKYGDSFYYVRGDYKGDVPKILSKGDRPVFATYAIAEGINLQHHYDTLLFLSQPLAFRTYYQARGRVYRSGQTHRVNAVHLLRQNIDFEVKKIINRKEDFDTYLRRRIQEGKSEIPF